MDENMENKFAFIRKQLGVNDTNEVLGEIYLYMVEILIENKSLRNCQNCLYDCDMLIRDSCEEWAANK